MKLSPKSGNWYMCRISNITYPLPPKINLCNNMCMCVGEVLLKQWKQGNTSFSKTEKRPLEIGVFFCLNFLFVVYVPLKILQLFILC